MKTLRDAMAIRRASNKVNNGKVDVPSILQEPQAVDKENLMATVVKDGYHKFEDVYKDVPADQRPKQTARDARRPSGSLLAAALLLFCGVGVALRLR